MELRIAKTLSPGLNFCTPGPISTTSPARSAAASIAHKIKNFCKMRSINDTEDSLHWLQGVFFNEHIYIYMIAGPSLTHSPGVQGNLRGKKGRPTPFCNL